MVDSKHKLKSIIDVGLALAGPQYKTISLLIRGAYQLYDAAKEINEVPSEMLALVEEYVESGEDNPEAFIAAAKSEYEASKDKLDTALD